MPIESAAAALSLFEAQILTFLDKEILDNDEIDQIFEAATGAH